MQANLDAMNQFLWHINNYNNFWLQELPAKPHAMQQNK